MAPVLNAALLKQHATKRKLHFPSPASPNITSDCPETSSLSRPPSLCRMIGIFWLGGEGGREGGREQSPYQFFHYDLMTEWPLFPSPPPPFRRLTGSLSQAAAAAVTLRSPMSSCSAVAADFFLYTIFFFLLNRTSCSQRPVASPAKHVTPVFGLDNRLPPPP